MEEEIKEEKLDSPLVVHKASDASYQETASEISMNATHTDEDSSFIPTLERHRFRKKKKSKKWPWILLAVIAVALSVLCALYFTNVISFKEEKTTVLSKKSYTTVAVNHFKDTITIKGTYIFFEGREVNAISGLEKEIKYLDKKTSFTVQDEHADSNFLNYEVLSMLSDYGFDYKITHIVSSGLVSKYEVTLSSKATEPSSKKKAEQTREKNKPSSGD